MPPRHISNSAARIGSRTRGPKTKKPIAGFLIAGLPRYRRTQRLEPVDP